MARRTWARFRLHWPRARRCSSPCLWTRRSCRATRPGTLSVRDGARARSRSHSLSRCPRVPIPSGRGQHIGRAARRHRAVARAYRRRAGGLRARVAIARQGVRVGSGRRRRPARPGPHRHRGRLRARRCARPRGRLACGRRLRPSGPRTRAGSAGGTGPAGSRNRARRAAACGRVAGRRGRLRMDCRAADRRGHSRGRTPLAGSLASLGGVAIRHGRGRRSGWRACANGRSDGDRAGS